MTLEAARLLIVESITLRRGCRDRQKPAIQILTHGVMDLCCFHQLFPWNPTFFGGVRFDEAATDGQVLALHQSHFYTLPYDLLKQFLEQLRFLKPSMPVF